MHESKHILKSLCIKATNICQKYFYKFTKANQQHNKMQPENQVQITEKL